jgi:hypothetical protein
MLELVCKKNFKTSWFLYQKGKTYISENFYGSDNDHFVYFYGQDLSGGDGVDVNGYLFISERSVTISYPYIWDYFEDIISMRKRKLNKLKI